MNLIGQRIKELRKNAGLTQKDLAEKCGYNSFTTINKIELGINNVPLSVVERIAQVFNVPPSYLLGWETTDNSSSPTKKIPMLGDISCGIPSFAHEGHEEYVEVGHGIKADFALTARGDSMIDANIRDGDIVFCKRQSTVDNGEIAVIIINDEATLKRVYYYRDKQKLVLMPENKKYEPFVYVGEELRGIQILGKAVALKLN